MRRALPRNRSLHLCADGLPLPLGSHRGKSRRRQTADDHGLLPVRRHPAFAQPAPVGGGSEATENTHRRAGDGAPAPDGRRPIPLPLHHGVANDRYRHRPRSSHPRHRAFGVLPSVLPGEGRHSGMELHAICLGDTGIDLCRRSRHERRFVPAGILAAPTLRDGHQLQVLPIHINNV